MQYDGLAWFTGLLALLALFIAARILFTPHWFLAWLRGTVGLAFLALALLIGVVAYDLRSYDPQVQDRPLVTLSFAADGPQRYRVSVIEGAEERQVTLEGDLWQLDARLLGWKGLAALIGLEPGYRLERLSGRFLAIEQQQTARHAQVQLAQSPYGIDLWRWLRLGQRDLFLFDAQAGRVTYLPIADGAAYSVSLSPTGLLAKPMNQAAEQALKEWE
ncbi:MULTISPECIES: hypothetical protein [Pseudomonas]|jgi:hypothetical protein|uniref:hypothetical protein n=1 Tax=Pseudomonas TaxID=286 RepID=UPI001C826C68|nr:MULTISPECIES: hypothetical protein [Pseudomonas]MDG9927505.1 hypothetical protein [Pseudomonas sp. GD04042]MDH0484434.1 hypothetical protein [Pseudomonas sp. GD04015]MDH0602926.1 hypothetical protein [Pseudomonas sp. GD03869]MDH0894813.1 hypothetical protein [Pseudomonas sp. GD03875]MDH1063989.1 hypothetical protein [Pseudomonas sp. GD03985]